MATSNYSKYIDSLTCLHVGWSEGLRIPHKVILMISVVELVREAVIDSPLIINNELLSERFVSNWKKYIQIYTPFVVDVAVSFMFIQSEDFVEEYSKDSFRINHDLFLLMQNKDFSEEVISNLVSTYLSSFLYKSKICFAELDPYKDKTLRDYQSRGKANIYKSWEHFRSVMYQMPTGTGKTKLFVSIAKDLFEWGAKRNMSIKILFLAHRIELVDQISENLGKKYNLTHGLITARGKEKMFYGLQVGSVQTLIRRLYRWSGKKFDFIIIDEAHHVKSDSYIQILKTFPYAKILGVTATPYRMSHASFKPEFEKLLTSIPIDDFIKEGWLCDYNYYSIKPDSKIQSNINKITKFAFDGDYLDKASVSIMDKSDIRANIVATYEKYAKGKKGIVYTINKAHNLHVCNQYVAKGYKAVCVDNDTPAKIRKKYVDDFRKGYIEIICNVNIFSEGFDCPDLEFIQLARPTKSLSMYLQQVGRGLRPAFGKEKLIILDNVGLYNRFGFPSACRDWQKHFDGVYDEQEEFVETRMVNNKRIIYMDEFKEGSEQMEMLHTTANGIKKDDNLLGIGEFCNNEESFRQYLQQQKGYNNEIVAKIVKNIKLNVDSIIKGTYNYNHKSIFENDNIKEVEAYLSNISCDPIMDRIEKMAKKEIIESLQLYIDFLKFSSSNESSLPEMAMITGKTNSEQENADSCCVDEVVSEIKVFLKWKQCIPKDLIQEYNSLVEK